MRFHRGVWACVRLGRGNTCGFAQWNIRCARERAIQNSKETPSLSGRASRPTPRDGGNTFSCGETSVWSFLFMGLAEGTHRQEKAHLPNPQSCHYPLWWEQNNPPKLVLSYMKNFQTPWEVSWQASEVYLGQCSVTDVPWLTTSYCMTELVFNYFTYSRLKEKMF